MSARKLPGRLGFLKDPNAFERIVNTLGDRLHRGRISFRCRAPEIAPVSIDENEPLKLRVFVDRSVVEVFVNGKQCVAVRVYPGREDSIGVFLRSQGQEAVLKSLDSWQMKNIYK